MEVQIKERKKKSSTIIIVAVVCSICFVSAAVVVLCIWMRCTNQAPSNSVNPAFPDPTIPSSVKAVQTGTRRFTYSQLADITRKFQNVIGEGGFGYVYYGIVEDGRHVAVKVLSKTSSPHGPMQFQNETLLLSKIHHRNLITLIGYCDDPDNLALVYEYMEKGSLHDHLSGNKQISLVCKKRLEIAIGAAQGLEYLHEGCKPYIVHRDVKPHNILLDQNLETKISDFGLSKIFENDSEIYISTIVMGTPGYLDPEYYSTQKLTKKSDVYSFGVVLLQLVSGLPAVIKEMNIHITAWVREWFENGAIEEIMDKRLEGNYEINSAWKLIELALDCALPTSKERPTMTEVLTQLKNCLEVIRDQERRLNHDSSYLNTGGTMSIEIAPTSGEFQLDSFRGR